MQKDNNNIVGYIIYNNNDEFFKEHYDEDVTYIRALEVDERRRNQGFFRKMMQTFLNEHKYENIMIRPYSEDLVPLYKKFDFIEYKMKKDISKVSEEDKDFLQIVAPKYLIHPGKKVKVRLSKVSKSMAQNAEAGRG